MPRGPIFHSFFGSGLGSGLASGLGLGSGFGSGLGLGLGARLGLHPDLDPTRGSTSFPPNKRNARHLEDVTGRSVISSGVRSENRSTVLKFGSENRTGRCCTGAYKRKLYDSHQCHRTCKVPFRCSQYVQNYLIFSIRLYYRGMGIPVSARYFKTVYQWYRTYAGFSSFFLEEIARKTPPLFVCLFVFFQAAGLFFFLKDCSRKIPSGTWYSSGKRSPFCTVGRRQPKTAALCEAAAGTYSARHAHTGGIVCRVRVRVYTAITGDHSKQDKILIVKIAKYVVFLCVP